MRDHTGRSFSHPKTTFVLVRSTTPPTVDGFAVGEPTGDVRCLRCDAAGINIDEIPHEQDCPQRFVKSEWWRSTFR